MKNVIRIGTDLDGVLIDHQAHKCSLALKYGIPLENWQTNSNLMRSFVPSDLYDTIRDALYAEMTVTAPPVAGALEHLRALGTETYIISRRRAGSIRYAQEWMAQHRVYDIVPAERIFFCETKEDKRLICERLGITAYIDDQISILNILPEPIKRVLLDTDGVAERLEQIGPLLVAKTWEEAAKILREAAAGK